MQKNLQYFTQLIIVIYFFIRLVSLISREQIINKNENNLLKIDYDLDKK